MILHPVVPSLDDSPPLDRRGFLRVGLQAGALAAGLGGAPAQAASGFPWQQVPGAPVRLTGEPSPFAPPLRRTLLQGYGAIAPGTGSSWTPLEQLRGTITPAYLHFERHHNGVPAIDPAHFNLVIHGLVNRPLAFDLETLHRYPMVTRQGFIECAGNSLPNSFPEPQAKPCGLIHGLISCSEWTGVPLGLLLEEAGVQAGAQWMLAEGADAASMSRSIPLYPRGDDMLLALYQNGEPLRPEQGYPWRLFLPGYEGNMNVKWLRRLKLSAGPTHTRDETSRYTDLLRDGRAEQFTFVMGVKSVITRPSGGMRLAARGFYELSGLAWSGSGRIACVEVSADGGASWTEAALQSPAQDRSFTLFSIPWHWDGSPARLQSRATDEQGNTQPTRAQWTQRYAPGQRYHYNAIQTWALDAGGNLSNVYA